PMDEDAWHTGELRLICAYICRTGQDEASPVGEIVVVLNAGEGCEIVLPHANGTKHWLRVLDTAAEEPFDMRASADRESIPAQSLVAYVPQEG
ncbi:hypothetical protein BMJ22_33620, partial [Sinorhizobium medicae]